MIRIWIGVKVERRIRIQIGVEMLTVSQSGFGIGFNENHANCAVLSHVIYEVEDL
jgi:hypothetical protein